MRIDRSYVLLDAGQTVADALALLLRHAHAHYAIVRRDAGHGQIYWYTSVVPRLIDALQSQPPDATLQRAMDLHEYTSAPVFQESAPSGAAERPGAVVLNARGRIAGVFEQVLMADAPGIAPPPPAVDIAPSPVSKDVPHGGGKKSASPPPAADDAAPPSAVRAPFAAWPKLDAPDAVRLYDAFDLEIGFAATRQPGVAGGPVAVVDAPAEFDVQVRVVAVGFDAPNGWEHDLHVVRDAPTTHSVRVPLVALQMDPELAQRTIAVQFFYEHNLCGQAQRTVHVGFGDPVAVTPAAPAAPAGVPVQVKPGMTPADLTVTVRLADARGTREGFVWSVASPHPVPLPETAALTELDADVGAFVDDVLQQIVDLAGSALDALQIKGIGKQIERCMPPAFWIALREVAAFVQRPPDVLFVTEETRIPWELAWMRDALDATRPAHLGAQVNFGRWILGRGRPALPPEHTLPWHRMVVVVGDYAADSGLSLPEAVAEAQDLVGHASAHATRIDLTSADLVPFLEAREPADGAEVVHFACHGRSATGAPATSALIMQDNTRFTPTTLEGAEIGARWAPFLFLNACEVGRAGVALGEPAGFAGAALAEGCRGFIGPLWKVESHVAREIALEFYRRTLDDGEPVAAVLRELRAQFATAGAAAPDTYLAYVYYGHPALRFARKS